MLAKKESMKTYLIRNKTGRFVEIPENLVEMVKQQGFEVINEKQVKEQPAKEIETAELVEEQPEVEEKLFACPVCGKTFKTQKGMKGHVRFSHPKKK